MSGARQTDAEQTRPHYADPISCPVLAVGAQAYLGDAVSKQLAQVARDVRGAVIPRPVTTSRWRTRPPWPRPTSTSSQAAKLNWRSLRWFGFPACASASLGRQAWVAFLDADRRGLPPPPAAFFPLSAQQPPAVP